MGKIHSIKTIEDIVNCTNFENIDEFIEDFRMILSSFHIMRNLCPENKFKEFQWVDDGKRQVSVKLISDDLDVSLELKVSKD